MLLMLQIVAINEGLVHIIQAPTLNMIDTSFFHHFERGHEVSNACVV